MPSRELPATCLDRPNILQPALQRAGHRSLSRRPCLHSIDCRLSCERDKFSQCFKSCDPGRHLSGTEKVPQRTFATKTSPNFRVNFLVQFASKPLFYWVVPSNCSENSLVLFVRSFGFGVLVWAPEFTRVPRGRGRKVPSQRVLLEFFWPPGSDLRTTLWGTPSQVPKSTAKALSLP